MLLFGFRKSERSLVEACVGLLLALIAIVFSLTWWIKTLLVFAVVAISVHLIFSSPTTIRFNTRSKLGISLLAIAIIAGITWSQLRGHYLNKSVVNVDQPNQPGGKGIVEKLTGISVPVSRPAKTDETLKSDTANLVKQLREFQQKIDDWNRTAATKLNEDVKNEKSDAEAHKLYIEHTKEFSSSMASLNKEFNIELKPQIILIKKELISKLPPKSVPPKPTVDYTLNYGFTTFPNAVGDIADYLENLAGMLPRKMSSYDSVNRHNSQVSNSMIPAAYL
jgi:hypothetical protein